MQSIISLYTLFFRKYILLIETLILVKKHRLSYRKERYINALGVMHNAVYYLCEQLDVVTGREHGSGFVLPGQAAQRKASRGDARRGKPSRCVGQARRERCPLVLKNTVGLLVKTDPFYDIVISYCLTATLPPPTPPHPQMVKGIWWRVCRHQL